MHRTHSYLLIALAWLVGWPLVFVPLFVKGFLPAAPLYSGGASILWGLGLAACFCAWAWADAPAHGKGRRTAIGFTAAWLVLPIVAVLPYLFATRGARRGMRACAWFLAYCLACVAVFTGVGMVSRMFI